MSDVERQDGVLLEARDVQKYFPIRRGLLRRHVGDVKAVDGVSFNIERGETLGLVGESGCGKTTLGRLLMRAYEPTGGNIYFSPEGEPIDVTAVDRQGLREVRRRMQMIFQDPYSSLNPRMTVRDIVGEPLLCYGMTNVSKRTERVAELLDLVGLNEGYMARYPHAFSGGQRQRIGVARAIALNPDLVIADEAVSALDVSIQAQVLNLLEDLQNKLHLTYLFISHDLGVIEHICDRVIVMYIGQIVEVGKTDDVFSHPRHPYVEALLSAVPRPDPRYRLGQHVVSGEVADPANRPPGCPFHPRCPYAKEICSTEPPPLRDLRTKSGDTQLAACHFAEELNLNGVRHESKTSERSTTIASNAE